MKNQLKTIIDAFFDQWECPSNKVYSEHLAEWIDKAIGIDRDRVRTILDAWEINKAKELANCITQSRPLKCEVE